MCRLHSMRRSAFQKTKNYNHPLFAFNNFRTCSTPLFINTSLFNPSLYMIARVSFWQFNKNTILLKMSPFRAMRRALRFWNHIIASNNAHSFACVRLFLHASTKVSCVGFIMRCPFREIATSRCSSQWH